MLHIKSSSKWIKDTNIQFLEENVGVNFHDLGFGTGFLDKTPKAQATKEKNRQIGFRQNYKLFVPPWTLPRK